MRVITGTAKGRTLETLSGNDVRPTTERVKEGVFSIIQFNIQGRRFLDLFAGSGQMGIEALSRGAREAVFVDSARSSADVIKRNLKKTNLEGNAKVLNTDSLAFASNTNEKFDLVFLDPPYSTGILQQALSLISKKMNKGGIIICESPEKDEIPQKIGDFALDRNYHYGKIKISTYSHEEVVSE